MLDMRALAVDLGLHFHAGNPGHFVSFILRLLVLEGVGHLGFKQKANPDHCRRHDDRQDDSKQGDRLTIEMHGSGCFSHVDGHGIGSLEALCDG